MFRFAEPFFALLWLVPFAMLLLSEKNPEKKQLPPGLRHPSLGLIGNAFHGVKPGRMPVSLWGFLFRLLIWFLMVAALMQPEYVDKVRQEKRDGYDILLAVDLSGSMKALDFSEGDELRNRLDVIKSVVAEFVEARVGDRVGLVVFGDHAYMNVPLTLDVRSVSQMLDQAVIGMAGDATAIGDALGIAVKNLRDKARQSRVIILLTDGANTAGEVPPLQAANIAKGYGIKIYTIGVGNNGLVPFPDNAGRIVLAQMDLDEALLTAIADTTGGKYFKASDQNALREIYNEINAMEKSESKEESFLIRDPLFRYPLGAALFLLFSSILYALLVSIKEKRHA